MSLMVNLRTIGRESTSEEPESPINSPFIAGAGGPGSNIKRS